MIRAVRLGDRPALDPGLSPLIGANLNGPAPVVVPDWAPPGPGPLRLYFSNHYGRRIELAFAERPEGPWRLHDPGVLHLHETPFVQEAPDVPQPAWAIAEGIDGLYPHIASPDVVLDAGARRFEMLLHGLDADGWQRTIRAVSADGISWQVDPGRVSDEIYVRQFRWQGQTYGVALGARILRREADGRFVTGPRLDPARRHRHPAALVRGGRLWIASHLIGDAPERLLIAPVDTSGDWRDWRMEAPAELLAPELDWEGADLPPRPSRLGGAAIRLRELRDPAFLEHGGQVWLAYAGAGEAAIGLARLEGL